MEKKLEVLRKIACQLNRAKITWTVGASMLLYLKGLVREVHDIDLMVQDADAERAKAVLSQLGTLQPPEPNTQYRTKTFLEFIVDGVEVDMMAGFAIVQAGQVYDCSLTPEQIEEVYDLDGEVVPLQSLALWRTYYMLMGRETKVQLLDCALGEEINKENLEN